MELRIEGNRIIVKGNIKSLQDYEAIKSAIETVKSGNSIINLVIEDSISITSSVIGYLLKIKEEGVNISLSVNNDYLYDIMDDLNLIHEFNVRKY